MKALYTKLGLEYQQEYSGPYNDLTITANGSRMILAEKDGKLSGFGRPAVCFGDTRSILKVFEKVYEKYGNIWYLDFLEDGQVDEISRYLLKSGIVPRPVFTQIIDLTKTETQLHAEMRKSYQNLANKEKAYAGLSIELLKDLHYKVSGKKTRSDKTWEIQQRMCIDLEAFCVRNESLTSAGLFIHDKETCYYGVAATKDGTVSHPVIWKAICHAKSLGLKELEMGEQTYSGDEKAVNISRFKRGFGGATKVRMEFRV